MINIKGIEKWKVLKALYDSAKPLGMGILFADNEPMTQEMAQNLIKDGSHFDYVKGRVMKVWLDGDEFDERLYDRDNGPGAAQRAIDNIK